MCSTFKPDNQRVNSINNFFSERALSGHNVCRETLRAQEDFSTSRRKLLSMSPMRVDISHP